MWSVTWSDCWEWTKRKNTHAFVNVQLRLRIFDRDNCWFIDDSCWSFKGSITNEKSRCTRVSSVFSLFFYHWAAKNGIRHRTRCNDDDKWIRFRICEEPRRCDVASKRKQTNRQTERQTKENLLVLICKRIHQSMMIKWNKPNTVDIERMD